MKNLSISFLGILGLLFTACQEDSTEVENTINQETVASLDLESEAALESGFEDVDVLAEAGLDILEMEIGSMGRRGAMNGGRPRPDHALDCATINKDTTNNILTIDFGEGCEGPHGIVRKGKIVITWSGNRHEYGASRTVTLENFFVDSLQLEGTRTVTNLTVSDSTNRIMNITMSNGKVTFPDGTFATREANHDRTHVFGEDESDDYATLAGTASGLRRDGTTYSATIIEDLVFLRGCWATGAVIPVQGTKEIVNGELLASIDFGDGTCDNEVVITMDGESITKTIEARGRLRNGNK